METTKLFNLTEEEMNKIKSALISFIINVSSNSDLAKPEELALLPVMIKIVLGQICPETADRT